MITPEGSCCGPAIFTCWECGEIEELSPARTTAWGKRIPLTWRRINPPEISIYDDPQEIIDFLNTHKACK